MPGPPVVRSAVRRSGTWTCASGVRSDVRGHAVPSRPVHRRTGNGMGHGHPCQTGNDPRRGRRGSSEDSAPGGSSRIGSVIAGGATTEGHVMEANGE